MSDEVVEEGIIVSTRRVTSFGGSRAVTLSKRWIDVQKMLGKDVRELVSIANLSDSMVIYVEPAMRDEAIAFMRAWGSRARAGPDGG